MQDIRVAIFEDNKYLRDGLYYLVNGSPGFVCTGAYPDAGDIAYKIRQNAPDVILMDIEMPGISGIDAVKMIQPLFPDIRILMQTVFNDDENIFNAICAGASGYILKTTSPAGYIDAIKDVYNGGSPLSPGIARRVLQLFQKHVEPIEKKDYQLTAKECDILQHMVKGKSFKMIAADLGIAYETVRTHMKNIYNKLHVNSNTEAVSKAMREKLV